MFGQRIAQKIWLGYAIPLAVLVVMGVLVPAALSAILGQITQEDRLNRDFVDRVQAMARAATDSETHLRGYLLTGDAEFRAQFADSLRRYRDAYRAVSPRTAGYPRLRQLLVETNRTYNGWLTQTAR